MRTFGICASILASAQLLIVSSPAFAQDAPAPAASASPSPADPPKPPDAATPSDAPKPPDTTARSDSPAADGTVEVHIDSPQAVSLERRQGGSQNWEHACVSPCDTRVSVSSEYRIMGTDLNESKPFMLDASKGKVVLTVRPGYHNKAETGFWVLVSGGAVFVAGVLVIALGSDGKTPFSGDGQTHLGNTNSIFIGSLLMLAGLGGSIFGASWLIDNSHSHVDGDIARPLPEKGGGGGAPGAEVKFSTSMRQPTWNAPKVTGLPGVTTVPLWTGKF